MDPNITCPIILNPTLNATLNATLYQPAQPWLKEWSPILLGIAQVLAALALAFITYKLWKSTSEYSRQVHAQTGIMGENQRLSARTVEIEERNRQRERLIKEMDALIGPLYSRLTDQQIFNAVDVSMRHGTISGEEDVLGYEASAFWQDIDRYKYLSSASLKADLEAYLEVKMGVSELSEFENQDSPQYKELEEKLINAIKTRYSEIETELSNLETQLEQLSTNIIPNEG